MSNAKPHLERTIGLAGAVALVIGGVIGAGIYALIGSIGAKAGSATWLAFVIAMFVSVVGAIPVIQVASAMPRAGAGYLFASRLLFPMAGTVTSGIILVAGASSTALTMIALTTYLPPALTFGAPPHWIAVGMLVAFYLIMLLGLRMAIGLQVIMVAHMLVALGIYCVAGFATTPLEFSFTPRLGGGEFFIAVVLCYNACMGFQVLAEMGEEIRHAKRTIPLALIIGGAIVSIIYIVIGTVLVNSLPYTPEAYDPGNAPLNASALLFLPAPVVTFVGLGALTAGLTSLNAAAVALPRELFAQSRDGMLPEALSRVAPHTHSPLRAITAFFALVVALVLPNLEQDFYGLMAAIGIQIVTAMICLGSLRLYVKYPELYRSAYIVFPVWMLWACTIVTVVVTAGFVVMMAGEMPIVIVCYAVLAVCLAVYHAARVAYARRAGIPYDERVRRIPGDDEIENDRAPLLEEQESEAQ
ncbi:MAG: APC family permease [Candidatus Hydrogenedentes bacterium]|nr:APC family permease [Candidatus Hydrogenedentota bacterium]